MTRNVKKNGQKRKTDSKQSHNRWRWLDTGSIAAALVGLVGVVLGVVLPYYVNAAPPPGPNLEVDSVIPQSFARLCAQRHPDIPVPPDLPGSETLDFKVRNTGDQLALITGIRIIVKSISITDYPNAGGSQERRRIGGAQDVPGSSAGGSWSGGGPGIGIDTGSGGGPGIGIATGSKRRTRDQ